MADEYINELEINGQKRLDLTQDTATAGTVLEGETFHLRSGAPAVGTYRPSDEIEARLRATVGHSSINFFNEKYRQGSAGNLTNTTAVTSKTIIPTTIGQKHIFHNFNQDYAYVIYGLNSAGASELLSGKIVSTSNRLFDSGYIRQFKYVYENNISGLVAYIIMIRKPQTSGGSNWIDITPDSIDQNIIMVTEYPVTSDTFVPYQIPTDEAKQDKPVVLYDAGATSVGAMTVTGLSNLTQYQELHITLFAPINGDDPDAGYTHTIVHPIIFPDTPDSQSTCLECRVAIVESGTVKYKQIGLTVIVANTNVSIYESDESVNFIPIPSNHYIYIKRIVGIP